MKPERGHPLIEAIDTLIVDLSRRCAPDDTFKLAGNVRLLAASEVGQAEELAVALRAFHPEDKNHIDRWQLRFAALDSLGVIATPSAR